ncbi:MAG TPA: 4-hydroxy-tetrahydrodipicolinate synthase [bacterium]|nr:4-hydroxy-tetrahydrodipicolinate synthase [bacterium]
MMRLAGIVVPVVTPLREHGVDEDATARLVDSLIRAGIHGLFVAGTTGEGPLLNVEERRTLLRAVRRETKGRVPVLAGIGAASTEETRRLSQWAADDGADVVVAMTPYFFAFRQSELQAHLEAVIRSSKLPVALYEIPQRTGNRLAVETVRGLMHHERLISVKDSSGDMGHFLRLLQTVRTDVTVLIGDDALILPAMAAGAAGAVSGLANVCPSVLVGLYNAMSSGNLSLARQLQRQVITGQDALSVESSIPAALKAALAAQGIAVGDPKPPLAPLSAEATERFCRALTKAGLLP